MALFGSLLAAAPQVAGLAGGGGKPVAQNISTVVTVVPPEVNAGEIIQSAFNQGSFHNGGFGLKLPSRYQQISSGARNLPPQKKNNGIDMTTLLLIGGAAVVGLVLLVR